MKTAYVANGNLPSRFAHSIQVIKNAQAWARASDTFCFYTNLDVRHFAKFSHQEINSFYGIKTPFTICKFPFFFKISHWLLSRYTDPVSRFLANIYYARVAKILKKQDCDLVYTRTMGLPKYTLRHGIPTVLETHGPPDGAKDKEDMYSLIDDANFLSIVTITEQLKTRLVNHGLPEKKVLVAPDGVDIDMYSNALSKAQAREKLGYCEQGEYVVYVGHLYKDRGIQEILYSAAKLPETTFIIVGGHQADIDYWQQQISQKKLSNVELVGFVKNSQVPLYQWMADILLMPYSMTCGTAEWMSPLKLFEYMASGRAIIATDMPVFAEILEHEKNAFLVKPDDGESLLLGLKQLLSQPTIMDNIGMQAQQDVQQYSWDARVKFIIESVIS